MKKNLLSAFFILCASFSVLHAQLKVLSNGNVQIGVEPGPSTSTKICIYNLAGKQLQCRELPAAQGTNTIEVRASSLQAGMYLYSLIVGNQLVDTKRMVLTE